MNSVSVAQLPPCRGHSSGRRRGGGGPAPVHQKSGPRCRPILTTTGRVDSCSPRSSDASLSAAATPRVSAILSFLAASSSVKLAVGRAQTRMPGFTVGNIITCRSDPTGSYPLWPTPSGRVYPALPRFSDFLCTFGRWKRLGHASQSFPGAPARPGSPRWRRRSSAGPGHSCGCTDVDDVRRRDACVCTDRRSS